MKILIKILCFIGWHKSDEKYDSEFFGVMNFTLCVHCKKRIYHKNPKTQPKQEN